MSRFMMALEALGDFDVIIVKLLRSVGPIKFGMKRSEVKSVMGATPKVYNKTKYATNTTDDFGEIHVYYDDDDKVEYVEIFSGTVMCFGKVIFPGTAKDLEKIVHSTFEDNISTNVSIAYEEFNGELKSIGFGKPKYFEPKVKVKFGGRTHELIIEAQNKKRGAEVASRVQDVISKKEDAIANAIAVYVNSKGGKQITAKDVKKDINFITLLVDFNYPPAIICDKDPWTGYDIGFEYESDIRVMRADSFY